jgi:hypothetical protein
LKRIVGSQDLELFIKLGQTIRAVQKAIAVERQVEAADDEGTAKEIIAAREANGAGEVEVSTVTFAQAPAKQNSVFELLSTERSNDKQELPVGTCPWHRKPQPDLPCDHVV